MEQVTNKVGRELIPQIPHAQPLIHNNKSTNNSAATGPSLSAQRSHFAQNNYTNITRATYAHSNQEKVSQLHVQCSMCQGMLLGMERSQLRMTEVKGGRSSSGFQAILEYVSFL